MKEEKLFDLEIKNKIELLERVPDLNWDEDRLWDKLEPKLHRPRFGRFSFLGTLLILILTWFCLPTLKKAFLPDTNREVQFLNQPILPVGRSTSIQVKAHGAAVKKSTAGKPMVEGNTSPNLPSVKRIHQKVASQKKSNDSNINRRQSTNLPNFLTAQQNDKPETILSDSLLDSAAEEIAPPAYPKDSLNRVENQPEEAGAKQPNVRMDTEATPNTTALEVELSGQKTGYLVGISKSYALIPRLSFIYGLGIHRYIGYPAFLESSTSPGLKTDVQIPLMVRYYFTLPENKLQGFVYGGLLNSWAINQLDSKQSYRLNFKSGLEVRYKYFQSKNGKSAAYFHLRVPLYQRNINNVDPFPALYNPLPKK